MRVRLARGRRRGLGLGLCGPGGRRPLAADVLAVRGPQQDALARRVQGPAVVRDRQVAALPAFGVGGPSRGLPVGVIQHQIGVCLVGQRHADVLRAPVELPGLALELEDGQVAVALEHQARRVVGRADVLVGEQALSRGEVGEPGVLGFVRGPRHDSVLFFFWGGGWSCGRDVSEGGGVEKRGERKKRGKRKGGKKALSSSRRRFPIDAGSAPIELAPLPVQLSSPFCFQRIARCIVCSSQAKLEAIRCPVVLAKVWRSCWKKRMLSLSLSFSRSLSTKAVQSTPSRSRLSLPITLINENTSTRDCCKHESQNRRRFAGSEKRLFISRLMSARRVRAYPLRWASKTRQPFPTRVSDPLYRFIAIRADTSFRNIRNRNSPKSWQRTEGGVRRRRTNCVFHTFLKEGADDEDGKRKKSRPRRRFVVTLAAPSSPRAAPPPPCRPPPQSPYSSSRLAVGP